MLNTTPHLHLDNAKRLGGSLVADVFLATKKNTDEKLLVKKIRPEFVLDGVIDHLHQQLNHLKRLDIPELLIPQLQLDQSHNLQLIQAYPEGQLLRTWLAEQAQIRTKTVLEIGIALAGCLAARHRTALVHKAIKPNNILIQENPIRIQLVDELQIVDTAQLSQFVNNNHYLRETLPYLAPEMTGQVRTRIDYYSDLYSLGAVLYECVTGRPPFISDDPQSIIHSHLAEEPKPASEHCAKCPVILSEIITTLLHKQPEKRYQSAVGLRADLQACLSALEESEATTGKPAIPVFQLRQHEISYQISIPSIMVGRDFEQQQLLDEYQRVCTGKLGVVMVAGVSGIGKTRLIQELELPIVAKHGYFTCGKFNQFSSHLPYSTLSSALNRLVRQILTEDSARISYWRERIQNVLGNSGQLITDIVPDLEILIGQQAELPLLSSMDARARFNDVFSRFLACIASRNHPLVLFIDDMQWCDPATFDLLELIFSAPESYPYLLIIGAYRSNEVDSRHRVNQLELVANQSTLPLVKLQLNPLGKADVNQMVAYILNTSPFRTEGLAAAIESVVGGNPLYVSEGLRWLHENERLLLSDNGIWVWEDDAFVGVDIPESASTLFEEKLKKCSSDTRDLLATGALLGAQFEGADLADIAQVTLAVLYSTLGQAFDQRILHLDKGRLYFYHDQIQAAAAKYLEADQPRLRHKLIARTYIDRMSQNDSEESLTNAQLFSIVEHLAAGRGKYESDAQRYEEAQFNYRAGMTAMESFALEAANHYLTQSVELCSLSMWDDDYEFMFSLHKHLARAAIINGDQNRANDIVDGSLEHLRSDVDRAELLYEQSAAFAALDDLERAIEAGIKALALLGDTLPVLDCDIEKETTEMQAKLHDNNRDIWQEIMAMATVEGRQNTLCHVLYGELLGYFYFAGQINMARLLALRGIDFSVTNGVSDFSCYALGCMSYFSCLDHLYPLAYKYESATLQLIKKYPATFGTVKTKVSLLWSSLQLRHSISELRNYSHETAVESVGCGELRYGGLGYVIEQWFAFAQGDNIAQLDNELATINEYSRQHNLALTLSMGEAQRLSLRPLLKGELSSTESLEVSKKIQQWHNTNDNSSLSCYYTYSGVIAYYSHRHDEAKEFLQQAEPLIPSLTNSIVEEIWFVFRYLVGLKKSFTQELEPILELLNKLSSQGPLLKPYMALIKAESTSREGDLREIRIHYLDAIDSANKEGYLLLEAFLNERLYQCLQESDHFSCEFYRNRANILYQACGVVNRIERPYAIGAPEGLQKPEKPWGDVDERLDTQFLFESVKTIASELDLNRLMATTLTSIMMRLGAKTGYLLTIEEGALKPLYKGVKQEYVSVISQHEDDFNTDKLSMAIANYVFNSREKVILDNAAELGEFIADPTVQDSHLRSVLCLPVIMQTEVLGVLYFENNLIESVFTENQVIHADVLTTQAAIALQNSKLLNDAISAKNIIKRMNKELESKVEKRTKELQKKQLELSHAGRLASLGELATGIAHELGQPLQIIQLASRIIPEELESDDFDKDALLSYSRDISKQIERATTIVSNMRTYARSDDNKEVENIDPSVPFRQCLVFFSEQFRHHQIDLKLEVDDKLPYVMTHSQKFQQIVVNLFSNACYAVEVMAEKSPKEYKKIVIGRLYLKPDQNFVVLEVEDNGIGMDEECRQECLKPFYTTKPAEEGTGLGLSIIKDLIDEFGFLLQIQSKPDKGSVFTVTMPVSD